MPQIKTTFGFHSTAEEAVNGIDLSETRIIVTGGSSGIGIETARTLALTGAEVTLAVRNVEAGNIVEANIKEKTSTQKVSVARLDFADLASVREFVGSWRGPLHTLINNAGIMALPELVRTREGYEMQFATNFLGDFALTVGLHSFLAWFLAASSNKSPDTRNTPP